MIQLTGAVREGSRSKAKLVKIIQLALFVFLLSLVTGCIRSLPPVSDALAGELHFGANWWTTDQMEDLDPDNPPPKADNIKLEVWDPSDPVGTPHPDVIDVVINIQNYTLESSIRLKAESRWLIGDFYGDQSSGEWTNFQPLSDPIVVEIDRKTTREVTVSQIPVRKKLDALAQNNQWAYLLEVSVVVESTSAPRQPIRLRRQLALKQAD